MKASWDQIVDYVRGLASAEVRGIVESDPEAQSRVRLLRQVFDAGQAVAPDEFANRAKALLPILPRAASASKGRLVYASSPLMGGFRSLGSRASNLRFEFENAVVEIRVEPIRNTNRIAVVGSYSGANQAHIRVGTLADWEAWCDELGQFQFEAADSTTGLRFFDALSGNTLEIDFR